MGIMYDCLTGAVKEPTKVRYRVRHPVYGEIIVGPAARKMGAVLEAAKAWGVPWSKIAGDCEFERLEERKSN